MATNAAVKAFVDQVMGSDATDAEKIRRITEVANREGVSLDQIVQSTDFSVDQIQSSLDSAGVTFTTPSPATALVDTPTEQIPTSAPVDVFDANSTDEEINAFVQQVMASGVTPDEQIQTIMEAANNAGISVDRLSGAIGRDPQNIRSALSRVNGRIGPEQLSAQSTNEEINDFVTQIQGSGISQEQATQSIANMATNAGISLEQLSGATGSSPQVIQQALTSAGAQIGPTTFGLQPAEQALLEGAQLGLNQVGTTQQQVSDLFGTGTQGLQPFVEPGQLASQQQAALSGVLGPEAQAQAFADFSASPGQAFLQEQGERGITRNAAAIGGLSGGNVQQELIRFGQGLAAQDFGNQFARLGEVAQTGFGAATNIAGLQGEQAGLQGQLGAFGASIPIGASQLVAANRFQAGRDIAQQIGGTSAVPGSGPCPRLGSRGI